MKNRFILLLISSTFYFISCTNKNSTNKFLGIWKTTEHIAWGFRLNISQSGQNFIIAYSNLPPSFSSKDLSKNNSTVFGFYDKSKDRLVIKADKELNAIYDKNTNQLIIEKWGRFEK